jgi:NitT/TauT family transport system permease protein
MKEIKNLFTPNTKVNKSTMIGLIVFQIIAAITIYNWGAKAVLPRPGEIFKAFIDLFSEGIILKEITTSTLLAIESMLITIIISLLISYLSQLKFFKPIAFIISKGRFLTLVGLSFVFTLYTNNGHQLKVSLLVYGISVFFTTSMLDVINTIKNYEYDHARTLGLSEWHVIYEVVILGQLDKVFEIIRQTFAMAWMMLTMVETISRSEGGIGTLLYDQNKYLHLDTVFAVQICVLLVGVGQDYLFGMLKSIVCPYAELTIQKS